MLSNSELLRTRFDLLDSGMNLRAVLQCLLDLCMQIGVKEIQCGKLSRNQFGFVGVAQFRSVNQTTQTSFSVRNSRSGSNQIRSAVRQRTGGGDQLSALCVNDLAGFERVVDLLSFQK